MSELEKLKQQTQSLDLQMREAEALLKTQNPIIQQVEFCSSVLIAAFLGIAVGLALRYGVYKESASGIHAILSGVLVMLSFGVCRMSSIPLIVRLVLVCGAGVSIYLGDVILSPTNKNGN